LVDEVFPEQPIRQWVLSLPFQLRFLFASSPYLMGRVLRMVYWGKRRFHRTNAIAIGPQQGRKAFTLQIIPAWEDDDRFAQVAKESGFSSKRPIAMAPRMSSSSRWISCRTSMFPLFGRPLSCKSAFLPMCHRQAGGAGAQAQGKPDLVCSYFP
jgi:hypothetical protein